MVARLRAGDVVEVEGGVTYGGGVRIDATGTSGNPIIIRGILRDGKRPVLAGAREDYGAVVRISGNFCVFENFEIIGGGGFKDVRGLRNMGHQVTVRDVLIRDCSGHGLLNSDTAGSLRLERVEVHNCGSGGTFHQIYIGMDTAHYPDGVFRMEFCFLHDAAGGNNVKTRALRNEIYYNWIEGAVYFELDLIGPDRHGGVEKTGRVIRCDSDVVGNVIWKIGSTPTQLVRLGGDGSGASHGRYRFVNNTFVAGGRAPVGVTLFKCQDVFESVEMINNVVAGDKGPKRIFSGTATGYRTLGLNNWLLDKTAGIPASWKLTRTGREPGFRDLAGGDFRLAASSPLRDSGSAEMVVSWECAFPKPLIRPEFHPPLRSLEAGKCHVSRPSKGVIDIGAFEGE